MESRTPAEGARASEGAASRTSGEGGSRAPAGRQAARGRRAAATHRVPVRQVPRRWRRRLAPTDPRKRKPKGVLTLWTRVRRLLWARWVWLPLTVWALVEDAWGWAVGAGVMTLATWLLALHESPPQYGLDHRIAAGSPEFLDSLAGLTGAPFLRGNRVDVLNNGDAFYPAMLDAVNAAERSITAEAYIYWAGQIGVQFADALAAASRRGVIVKILLDSVGSSSIGEDILQRLEAGRCQLAWFNPVHWYTIDRFNNRTHRKSLIVDGRVAFTGGAGIADHWCGQAQDADHWRDLQVRIEGPGAIPLQTGFAQNWMLSTGEVVSGPEFFPGPVEAGPVALQMLLSSPSRGVSHARALYYFGIAAARHSLLIANPYFVPDHAAIDLLVDARTRNVDVKIMVSGRHIDNWLARRNSIRLFGRLLHSGVEIHEYNRTMLHHKVMIVDGAWATVGTANFDNRSFAFNEESNMSSADPDLAQVLERTFLDDLGGCDRVTLKAWKHRGVTERAGEWVAALLQDQV